ncbi:MAG: cyclic nucleotide-binding domain-containing protein [Spirochaetes bacterium]|nr:cyclic nucleotide-binding domain-containing protein [Spirochaetota bacterium]
MDLPTIIFNLSYVLVACAYIVRDILYLRFIIIFAEALSITYGFAIGNMIIAGWNSLFIAINIIWVTRLINERKPVIIPENLEFFYKNIFPNLSGREFLYFWNMGKISVIENEYLCRQNDVPGELMMILDGRVSVLKSERQVTELSRGCFVAEMSFLTGDPASADVRAIGSVEFITWSRENLQHLKEANNQLLDKLHVILGRDLSYKLKNKY